MSDDIDTRLREYAERWRDTVPVSEPDLANLGASRRPLLVPTLVAAAVVAVIVGVTATRLGEDDTTTPPSEDPTVVVPWAALEPTYPHFPTRTEPIDRDPAVAALEPLCGVDDVVARRLGEETATLTYILRAGAGDTRCRLEGSPDVALRTGGRLVIDVPVLRAPGEHDPVLVADGLSATITFSWAPTACFDPPVVEQFDIPMADGLLSVDGFGVAPCLKWMSSDAVSPILVGAFAPRETEREVAAYDGVTVRLASEPARRGDAVSFTVELTATEQDLPLEPCPDHSLMVQNSYDDFGSFPHGLNCAAVPFRDEEGAPYLPQGVPVQFEMLWEVPPAPNAEGVDWRLELPAAVVLELPRSLLG